MDAVDVWRAAVGVVMGRAGAGSRYIVLVNRTAVGCLTDRRRFCLSDRFDRQPYAELSSELQARLAAVVAGNSVDIPDLGDSRARRVNPDEIETVFAETDKLIATLRGTQTLVSPETFWNVFYSRFPQSFGYLVLTAPAFDSERRHAVVLSDHMYASLGGEGLLLVFVRDDGGKWVIKARLPRWIS